MSSSHQGVRCDSCNKFGFKAFRYKCLICNDYDLCSNCYALKKESEYHLSSHPMQVIMLRDDFEAFFNGESYNSKEFCSYTCPFCGLIGFDQTSLAEHVNSEHSKSENKEYPDVLCPICCSPVASEANDRHSDFPNHLASYHRLKATNKKAKLSPVHREIFTGNTKTVKDHNQHLLSGIHSNPLRTNESPTLHLPPKVIMREMMERFLLDYRAKKGDPVQSETVATHESSPLDEIVQEIEKMALQRKKEQSNISSNVSPRKLNTQITDEVVSNEESRQLENIRCLISDNLDSSSLLPPPTERDFEEEKNIEGGELTKAAAAKEKTYQNKNTVTRTPIEEPFKSDFHDYFLDLFWSSLNTIDVNE